MSLENTHLEQLQGQYPRDLPTVEEAAGRANPGLATSSCSREREPPPGGTWRFATPGKVDQTISGTDVIPGSPGVYQSPAASHSGSSMSGNADNLTPSETPPQEAESPGPSAGLERLSLDNSGPHNRAQAPRGRISTPGAHPAPKRAASRELPRRASPASPVQNATARKSRGSKTAAGSSRRKAPYEAKHYGTPTKLSNQYDYDARDEDTRKTFYPRREYVEHGGARSSFDAHRHATTSRQPVARDSGYGTMPSRQATRQQGLEPAFDQQVRNASGPDNIKRSPTRFAPTTEEPKGVVHRLAGPVPVLIDSRYPNLIMQPESSPISQDQLAAEVKGIYGGLVMVEAKCINIDAAQAADPSSSLGPEQWQALIALHRTLLYEHHDFLMATQHPSATPALSGLAQKYSMPARMWRHAIHAFLEVLRHRRPQSQDYMLSFIYLAYQMMALLFETVPAFTDTWIECLGDLARYRMAIEEDKEAHSIWGGVAARWYNMASDRHYQIGRLYHHLGILERPSLRKMSLYAKSLTAVIPFYNAKDSLNTLCNSTIQCQQSNQSGIAPAETTIVTYYAYRFGSSDKTCCTELETEVLSQLKHQPSSRLREIGVPLLITNIAALFQLGSHSNQLWAYFTQSANASIHSARPSAAVFPPTNKLDNEMDTWPIEGTFADESVYSFCYSSFEQIMHRGIDTPSLQHVLPSVHTILVWLHGIYSVRSNSNVLDNVINSLFTRFAWQGLCDFLNTLIQYEPITDRIIELAENGIFPGSEDSDEAIPRALPEDYNTRGLIWSHSYAPVELFSSQSEDDARSFETSATHKIRVERVLWVSLFLALRIEYFNFDMSRRRFDVSASEHPQPTPIAKPNIQEDRTTTNREVTDHRIGTITSKPSTSSTIFTHSDSEGYTIVSTSKSKVSYAQVASGGYDGVLVVDDDETEMQLAT